jgi:hypothetical protein
MQIIPRLLTVVTLAITTSSALAVTYIVPTDRDLVMRSEAIVDATAVASHSQYTADGRIVTVITLAVEESFKGAIEARSSIDLIEPGGFAGDRGTIIPGSPRYADGKRYMVFLRRTSDGWATYGFGLGKFEWIDDAYGDQFLTRGGGAEGLFGWDELTSLPHVETLRDRTAFQSFVRSLVANPGAPVREDYFVAPAGVAAEAFQPLIPDSEVSVPGGLDGVGAMTAGTSNWTGAGFGVHYNVGASNANATGGLSHADGINAVLFNDPSGIVPNGVAALGGQTAESGGGIITEVDVVVSKNFSTNQATFNGLMTHEMGHTLGFRHSDKTADDSGPCVSPSPCSTTAIMNSSIAFNLQTLQQWDLDAVRTVYGGGGNASDYLFPGSPHWSSPTANFDYCFGPTISVQPANKSIVSGAQTTLNVTATGTNAAYQWYVGNPPSTTTTASNGTTSSLTVSPAATTNYWVRVIACSGPANSNAATVTVTTCTPPSAPAPVAAPSTITSGQSSTITETPAGSGPFTYQWYSGNSGVTTNPIGGSTSNNSITVSPTVTTSYWVRVTGQCAPTSDSPVATVTVAPCVPPSASTPIASPSSIPTGQSSTVSVSVSGSSPFTYQWFSGNSGVTTSSIGGPTSNNFITVSPTTSTAYWVRVTGQCAPPSDSPSVLVTVTCSPIQSPGVTASPSTINAGQSSTLSFNTAGNGPFTIQWFTGNQGDLSKPINGANGTSTVVSPTSTQAYWVRVSGGCGTQDGSVIVFVNGSVCVPASITTQPAGSTIASGTPVTLTVIASGTAPLTFQWYTGEKGDTSNLITGATSATLIRSPTITTKYWVRVTGCNNSTADSNAATITVSTCTSPSIGTQPANVSAPIGTVATLKVVAAGTGPLHYQWYEGAKGITTKTAGTDSATFITGAVSADATYWVRVTGQCGTADSNAATVTATAPPRGRAVRH